MTRKPHPDAQLLANPQPGDRAVFSWRGAWVHGIVAHAPTGDRVQLQRENGPRPGRRIYWRNLTRVYRPGPSE